MKHMILMTARLIKILLFLIVLLGGFFLLRRVASKKYLVLFGILAVLFAVTANTVAGVLPPLSAEVTLTALREKREEANSDEIFLAGYTVDGKTYLAGESMEITGGKWFWSGETYAWRNEADSRQPEGTTRSISILVPVGWERSLQFDGNTWRGMVEISTGENTWVVDTFSESDSVISVPIGRSQTSVLIGNQICHLALYMLVLLVCSAIVYFAIYIALQNKQCAQLWLTNNSGKLIYGGIAIFILVLMIYFADRYSLWIDELWEIYFVKGTLRKALQWCIDMSDGWPPFFTLTASIWYHIAPYGQRWLLLITIIPSAFSIYIVGRIGEKLEGRTCGILAALFTGFSTTLWLNAAYEFRAYAFLTTCSAIALYCYIRRNESGKKRWIVLFSLSLTALAMSHYFGMLCCGAFFLSDVFLLWKKRIRWNVGLSYVLPGTASIVWLGIVYVYTIRPRSLVSSSAVYPSLTFSNITSVLRFLTGNFDPVYFVLLIGLIISMFHLYKLKENTFNWSEYHAVFLTAMIVFFIFFIFICGNFISSSLAFAHERYYMALLPYVCVLSALTVYKLCIFIGKLQKREYISQKTLCTAIGVILSMNCLAVVLNPFAVSSLGGNGTGTTMPFREAADWIYTQSNYIFNEDTVIISTSGSEIPVAWDEYYVTRQGRRDSLNHVSMWDSINAEYLLQYNRIYVNGNWRGTPYSLQNFLNMYYALEIDRSDIGVQVYTKK